MSEAVSALNGARFDGLLRIEEGGLHGMITLRGDLGSAALQEAVKLACGLEVPAQREVLTADSKSALWMSPDELLILLPYGMADETVEQIAGTLKGEHFLAENVSDARTLFHVGQAGDEATAREVLAKLCPVDFAPAAFPPGMIRRSRLAQVPAAIWLEQGEGFRLICFRSVAQYAYDALCLSGTAGGEVGFFTDMEPKVVGRG